MTSLKPRVLVLGDDSRSTLSVVRSLGKRGIRVTAGVESKDSIVRSSRFLDSSFVLPSTADDLEAWLDGVEEILKKDTYDLLIPAVGSTFIPIVEERERFSPLVRLAIPDRRGFLATHDKRETLSLATTLGIPHPHTKVVTTREEGEGVRRSPFFPFPFIIKPTQSTLWWNEYRVSLGAHLVSDVEVLGEELEAILPFTPALIQAFVPGKGVGQEFLSKNGEILLAFQHERIHEPEGSGGSSYRKSVPLDPRLLACSEKIIRELKWTGPIMIEYRVDPVTRAFWLIEINGRLWGSLPLAVAAGMDFPYGVYMLFTEQEVPHSKEYKVGVRARNLINDMRWSYKRGGLFGMGIHGLGAVVGFLFHGEKWDTFDIADSHPFFVELYQNSMRGLGRIVRKMERALPRISHIKKESLMNIEKHLKKNKKVLFVCHGNIIRSPFAERYAKKIFREAGESEFEFFSSGMHPETHEWQSPPLAQQAAEVYGVELKDHRSHALHKDMVQSAGVIFCMDSKNYRDVQRAFPESKEKLFFLSAFLDEENRDIGDPWGRGYGDTKDVYGRIKKAIDLFLAEVKSARDPQETEGR